MVTAVGGTAMLGRLRPVALAVAGATAAVTLTPAGLEGLLYPLRYVDAGDWGLANIPEWQSPNFHDAVQLPFLAWIIVPGLLRLRGETWLRVLYLGGIGLGLLANRNIPVAAMLGLPAVAASVAAHLPNREATRTPSDAFVRRVVEMGIAAAVLATAWIAVPVSAGVDGVVLERYPAAAIDRLERVQPDARVFAEYGWGGYVIERLSQRGARVFVDGRNDMYDQSILELYSHVRAAEPGWEDILGRYGVNAIVLPPDAPLVIGQAQASGWCELVRDETQVLLRPCESS